MSISARFYRSLYLTLGMACACLGYAEWTFLPEIAVFAAIVGVMLALGYWAEGRWSLSIPAANALGGIIALGAIGYVAAQFFRPFGASLIDTLPWPTSLLPYLGPLLMVLIPAKLFRPKHIGDIWSLHGVGLITVALGCALAGDSLFGVLLFLYMLCFVWSLTLFYFYRHSLGQPGNRVATDLPPTSILRAGLWSLAGTSLALFVFLVTPRSSDARWEFSFRAGSLQTGLSDERPSIDLNNSGVLAINRDLAFEVRAFEADEVSPKTDLNPNQYWRTVTFNYYENGRWEYRPDGEARDRQMPRSSPPIDAGDQSRSRIPGNDTPVRIGSGVTNDPLANRPRGNAQLPNLGPEQVFFKYFPQSRSGQTPILAEPIWRVPFDTPANERRVSVVTVMRERQSYWYQTGDGELAPPAFALVSNPMIYRQVIRPTGELLLGPRVRASETYREHHCNCRSVPALREWTDRLVRSMEKAGTIPAAALGPASGTTEPIRVPPAHSESVARMLRAHLAASGEFEYTLNLQRQNERLDPVEDFLLNVKVGHCQRFATALVLMLRSVGIPSRVVLGYRGFDTDGSGVYEVRQNHAHAWAEALVPRTTNGAQSWHWLTLDPTPQAEEVVGGGFALREWIEWFRNTASTFFRYFIVEYDSDQQGRARNWFGRIDWAATLVGPQGDQWWRLPVVVAAVLGAVIWIRGRRRRSAIRAVSDPASDLLRRFVGVFRRTFGIELGRGQTPAEFARAATRRLVDSPDPELPNAAVAAYYRMRFGHETIPDREQAELLQRLDRFEVELGRQYPRWNAATG